MEKTLTDAFIAVHMLIAESATITKKIAVHVMVVSVYDPAEDAITLAHGNVATGGAVDAD